MFRNETFSFVITLLLASGVCSGQKTWWGEFSGFAGGGNNEIFRFDELIGSGSVTGKGYWIAGVSLSRLYGEHFALESGLSYSHQYYFTSPAPGIGGDDEQGSLGLITVPFTARVDFLKFLFADAGPVFSMQTNLAGVDNMTGLGATLGAGIQYRFKSDIFVKLRAYATQYGLFHFIPEENPQTLLTSGVTLGVGYRFIRLGHCNCPDDISPSSRFR
jgi:opacity protein-like surface antigen